MISHDLSRQLLSEHKPQKSKMFLSTSSRSLGYSPNQNSEEITANAKKGKLSRSNHGNMSQTQSGNTNTGQNEYVHLSQTLPSQSSYSVHLSRSDSALTTPNPSTHRLGLGSANRNDAVDRSSSSYQNNDNYNTRNYSNALSTPTSTRSVYSTPSSSVSSKTPSSSVRGIKAPNSIGSKQSNGTPQIIRHGGFGSGASITSGTFPFTVDSINSKMDHFVSTPATSVNVGKDTPMSGSDQKMASDSTRTRYNLSRNSAKHLVETTTPSSSKNRVSNAKSSKKSSITSTPSTNRVTGKTGKNEPNLPSHEITLNERTGYASNVLSMSSLTPSNDIKLNTRAETYSNTYSTQYEYMPQNGSNSTLGSFVDGSTPLHRNQTAARVRTSQNIASGHELGSPYNESSPARSMRSSRGSTPSKVTTPIIYSPAQTASPVRSSLTNVEKLSFVNDPQVTGVISQSIGYTSLNHSHPSIGQARDSSRILTDSALEGNRINDMKDIKLSQDQIQLNLSNNHKSILQMENVFNKSFSGLFEAVKRLEEKSGILSHEDEERLITAVLEQVQEKIDSAVESKVPQSDTTQLKEILQNITTKTETQKMELARLEKVLESTIMHHKEKDTDTRSFVEKKLKEKLHDFDELRAKVENFDELITHSNIVEDLKSKIELVDDLRNMIEQVDSLKVKIDDIDNLSRKLDSVDDLKTRIEIFEEIQYNLKDIEALKENISIIEEIKSKITLLDEIKIKFTELNHVKEKLSSIDLIDERIYEIEDKVSDISALRLRIEELEELEEKFASFSDLHARVETLSKLIPKLDQLDEMKVKFNIIESLKLRIEDLEEDHKLREIVINKQFEALTQQQKSDQELEDTLSQVVSERMTESENRIRNSLQSLLSTKHFRRPLIKDILDELKSLPNSPGRNSARSPTKGLNEGQITVELNRLHERINDLESSLSMDGVVGEDMQQIHEKVSTLAEEVTQLQSNIDERMLDMNSSIQDLIPELINKQVSNQIDLRDTVLQSINDSKQALNQVMDAQSVRDLKIFEFSKELSNLTQDLQETSQQIRILQSLSHSQAQDTENIHNIIENVKSDIETLKKNQGPSFPEFEKRFDIILQTTNEALESNLKKFMAIEESKIKNNLQSYIDVKHESTQQNLQIALEASLIDSLHLKMETAVQSIVQQQLTTIIKQVEAKVGQNANLSADQLKKIMDAELVNTQLQNAMQVTRQEMQSLSEAVNNLQSESAEIRNHFEGRIGSVQNIVDAEARKQEQLAVVVDFTREKMKIISNDFTTLREFTSEIKNFVHRIETLERLVIDESERYTNLKATLDSTVKDLNAIEKSLATISTIAHSEINEIEVRKIINVRVNQLESVIEEESKMQNSLKESLEQMKEELMELRSENSNTDMKDDSRVTLLLDRISAVEDALDLESRRFSTLQDDIHVITGSFKKLEDRILHIETSKVTKNQVADIVQEFSNELEEQIQAQSLELQKSITQTRERLQTMDNVVSSLQKKEYISKNEFVTRIEETERNITSKTNALHDSIDSSNDKLMSLLKTTSVKLISSIDDTNKKLSTAIEETNEKLSSAIEKTNEEVHELNDVVTDMKETEITSDRIKEILEDRIDDVAKDIENGTLISRPRTIGQRIVNTIFSPKLWFVHLPAAIVFGLLFMYFYELFFPIQVMYESFNTIS